MASSSFLAQKGKQQDLLLHRLVTHFLPVQKGEENYATAMEFCAGNLNPKYHRYKDVNPKQVKEIYSGLSNRMEQHSQLSKASHLRQLCSHLTSLGLQGSNEDMDAALLLLLFGLANKPLQQGRLLTPQKASPTAALNLDAAAAEATSEESRSEDASSTWSSESQLSDWEEEKADSVEGGQGAICDQQTELTDPGMMDIDFSVGQPPSSEDGDVIGIDAASLVAGKGAHKASAVPALPPCIPVARRPSRSRPSHTLHPSASAAGRLHMPTFLSIPAMAQRQDNSAAKAPSQQQLASPRCDDLVPCLVRHRLRALPFMAPQPEKCLSDQYITHQVLNLLLNDTSTCFEHCSMPSTPSSLLPNNHGNISNNSSGQAAPCYQPLPGLHVPYLSPGMLHNLLCEFAEAGSQLAWLQTVIASSANAATGQAIQVPGITDALHATPCCQALLQAASTQLRAISRPLIELQQANKDGCTAGFPSSDGTTSLLQLREQCNVPMRRLATLHEAVHMALFAQAAAERTTKGVGGGSSCNASSSPSSSVLFLFKEHGEAVPRGGLKDAEAEHCSTAAHASSVLLDALHLMLESNVLMTGPVGQVLQQQLLHLFLCTLTPLLDGLYTWLYDNWEDQFPEDFFVAQGQLLPETHHLFWSEAFRLMLRHNTAPGSSTGYGQAIAEHVESAQVACPRFLQPVACEIFSAGKSLRLLKNSEQGGASAGSLPKGVSPLVPLLPPIRAKGLHAGARHRAPLQQQFLDHLHNFLAGHELCPTAPACGEGQQGGPARQPVLGGSSISSTEAEGASRAGWGIPDPHETSYLPSWQPAYAATQPAELPMQGFDSGLGTAATQTEAKRWCAGVDGVNASYKCNAEPKGFSGRMAAAGMRQSTLQAGGVAGLKAAGHQELQPPLSYPSSGLDTGFHSNHSAGSDKTHEPCTVGAPESAAGRGKSKGGVSKSRQGENAGLEAQCNIIAAAMSRGDPSMAWNLCEGQHSSHDSIRPDMAQNMRDALLPSALSQSNAYWLRPKDQAHKLLGWLLEEPCLDLPPVELMLEHSLLGILRQRVEDIGQCLLSCLLSDWGLLAELSALKNLFLMASPAAQAWADRTLSGMLFNGKPLEEHHEYEIEVALQEVIAEAGQDEALPSVDTVSVMLDKERAVEMRAKAAATKASELGSSSQAHLARSAHCALHSVLELEGLQVRYQPSWLMSMIGGSNSISSYNNALVFLMQIRAARMALEDARVRSWKSWKVQALSGSYSSPPPQANHPAATGHTTLPDMSHISSQQRGQPWIAGSARPSLGVLVGGLTCAANLNAKEEDLVMQEMSHFVSNLDQFVVDRLLCGAWMQLEEDLDQARTLDDVVRHHGTFLATLDRQAGRGTHGDTAGAWKHLVFGINKVLDQVLLFCSAQRALTSCQLKASGGSTQLDGVAAVQDSLRTSSSEFRRLHRYLLKFLGNKTHKIGGEPDLENLIMRINFNYFYDSSFM